MTWAHPEFGQILATCSFDRTAAVWEEMSKTRDDLSIERLNLILSFILSNQSQTTAMGSVINPFGSEGLTSSTVVLQ